MGDLLGTEFPGYGKRTVHNLYYSNLSVSSGNCQNIYEFILVLEILLSENLVFVTINNVDSKFDIAWLGT